MNDEVWEDDLYKNWVRGAKGLEFLQEGLKDFVEDKALKSRNQQLQNITKPTVPLPQCSLCTSQNLLPQHANPKTTCTKKQGCIQSNSANCYGKNPKNRRKCPNGICSKLYDSIVLDHRFRDPFWKNTDPTTWCTDQHGWSYAKCFQTTLNQATSATETDASGLLSIIINNCSMEKWLACQNMGSNTACNFYIAREIRNSILHSPKFELGEDKLNKHIDTFIGVLKDVKCLASYKGSQDAIDKLEKLKSNQITITQTDGMELRKICEEIRKRETYALQNIEDKGKSTINEVKREKRKAEDEIKVLSKKSKAEIETEKTTALGEIVKQKVATITAIEDGRKVSASEIDGSKEKALNEIDDSRKNALSEIEEARKQQTLVTAQGGVDVSSSNEASSSIVDARQQEKGTRQVQLQQDLAEFYRQRHQKLPLSPLFEEDNTPLLKFYVMPEINSVKVQRTFGGGAEIKTPIETLRNVFFEESSQFTDIYLSADAGLGKTAFSKRLAMTWCQAHAAKENEKEFFKNDEIDTVNDFDFLFLIFLRDSSRKCDIIELINDQIIQDLPLRGSPVSEQDIDMVLSEKRCLVVLDGLDEWTHPTSCEKRANGIPHRKVYKKCTFLTTSRPWKLNAIDFSSPKFELVRLNKKSKYELQIRVISQLTGETDGKELQNHANTFSRAVAQHNVSDLDSIPLLLMYLLCLWWDDRGLGQTLCELYSNIVELLLSRTVKKYDRLKKLALPQVDKRATVGIPQCFREQNCCTKYYTLLETVANLAFQTLFNKADGKTLVFDKPVAENCLNNETLQFCLEAGMLSQSQDRIRLTKHEEKISFAHKTMQEFFAALHMHSVSDKTTVQKVLSQCNSVKDILEMSKIFIFLGGIDVHVLRLISRELIEVINKDKITQKYRTMTFVYDFVKYTKPLRELQAMYISCVKERPQNAELKLCHQDIIIDEDCREENYFKHLQKLAVQNKENIRSVSLVMEGIQYKFQTIIANFEVTDLGNVDKIYYRGEFDNYDIGPLLHSSVKCLTLISNKWQDNHFVDERSSWSDSLSSRFYSLGNLECIYVDCFVMSHHELEKLVKHLSTRNCMREIALSKVYCTNHDDSCAGFSLDLTKHSQLSTLRLGNIPLSELNINVASLEECRVGPLSKPGLVSRFLSSLPAASKLHTFTCSLLDSTEGIETMLATLRKLVHVKQVRFISINLDDRELPLSPEMTNIEFILLANVKLTASVFSHLVNQVNKLQQTVAVSIRDCTITPDDEFKTERDKIEKSPDFSVTFAGKVHYNRNAFEFTTVNKCD